MMLFRIASAFALLGAAQAGWAAELAGTVRIVFVGDIMLDGGPGHVVTNGVATLSPQRRRCCKMPI
jgi:hypothetical protein